MGRKDGVTVMWLAMLCDDCYTLATTREQGGAGGKWGKFYVSYIYYSI